MTTPTSAASPTHSLSRRVAAASIWVVLSLVTSAFIGEKAQELWGLSSAARGALQAVLMSTLVVSGIWWLRIRVDRRTTAGVGLETSSRSLRGFAIGVGIVAAPVLVVIASARLFGWATISIDTSAASLGALALGVATIFLFEALPEELVIRGYVYRNLSATHTRLRASILATLLFLTLPLLAVPIQMYLLGMDIQVNGASSIQPGYLITMLIFGAFVQYLRVLSGTIWIGVGFHAAFVLINRIMGPRESQMIRFEEIAVPGPLKWVAFIAVGGVLVTLFAWPWIVGRSFGWREIEGDTP